MRTLFGVATVYDLNSLHEALDELQLTQKDIVHSTIQQVTYIKKLDTVTSVTSQAIANLSGILKDVMIKSDDKFKQITRDILWLNVTKYNYSEMFMIIRQLEFAIL